MMVESMTKTELNKTELFADYISRYQYKDMNKAMEDFEEIFKIIDTISYALQINSFNGHPRHPRSVEDESVMIFQILCERGIIDSYPFETGDRYRSFSPQLKGD